VDTSSLNSPS